MDVNDSLLVRTQVGMRYALETGGKILATQYQISLELGPVVMWKRRFISDKLRNMAEISKQSLEGAPDL